MTILLQNPNAPFVSHKGKRLIYISELGPFSGPFYDLQKLREGSPHLTLFRDAEDKISLPTIDESIRNDLAFFGLTLADIGSSEEEVASLIERNLRQRAAEQLVQARSGFAWALSCLSYFERIRAHLKVDYEALGTSEEEVRTLLQQMHLANAKLLLNEVRMPHKGKVFVADASPDNLAELEEHLAKAGATHVDLGFSDEEWEALKRQRLVYHVIGFLKELRAGLDYYDDPFEDGDYSDSRRPLRAPVVYLELIQNLLNELKETPPALLDISDEEFASLARHAILIRLVQNLSFVMDEEESEWKKERLQYNVDEIRRDMANYGFTWDDVRVTSEAFELRVQKWGLK